LRVCNKTANINVKKLQFKTLSNGDTPYITQLKQQKTVLLFKSTLTLWRFDVIVISSFWFLAF